jgi:NADH:ubiquinone oxidoreductase subunit 4 (subunit M)
LALTIVVFGLQPSWVLRWSETTIHTLYPPVAIAANLSPSQPPLP